MKLGLFGGSFDPVHLGHLLVARAALEELALDRLHLIPAAQSPFKPASLAAPGAVRLRMLRLAFAGWTQVEVDDQELRRAGVSFSVETVRHYASRFPGAALFYLIGQDHVAALPRWRDAATLGALAEFVVIPRPGEPPATAPDGFRVRRLGGFPIALSSSQVRARVAAGQPVDLLVPVPVAEVIREERLYG